MAAGQLLDLARMVVSSGGTGTLTLSGAAPGYLTFTQAGSVDANVYSYGIIDGSASEVGSATMGGSGTTLSSRTVDKSTNSNAAINVSVGAQVFICARRENILSFAESMTWLTATEQETARGNLYAAPFDALAFNNMIDNGAMEVAQELAGNGLVEGGSGFVGGYLCDRWNPSKNGNFAVTWAQVASSTFPGYANTAKMTVQTAKTPLTAGEYMLFVQNIEGYRFSRAMWGSSLALPITVGFWIKSTVGGKIYGLLYDAVSVVSSPLDVTVAAATAQWCTFIFPAQTTWNGSTTNGIGAQFRIGLADPSAGYLNPASSTSNTLEITGFVMTVGNALPLAARSPLLMRPYQDELRLVRRWYETSYNRGIAAQANVGAGGGNVWGLVETTGARFVGSFAYAAPKRGNPTVIAPVDNAGNYNAISYFASAAWHNSGGAPNIFARENAFSWQGAISADFVNFDFIADARI